MRFIIRAAAICSVLVTTSIAGAQGLAYTVPDGTSAAIRKAIESPDRSDEHRVRDRLRKPAEVLTLAGIEEGDQIIEFASFGHYYTTLLADVVGPSGHVYMIDMPWTEPFGGRAARAFDAAHENATYTLAHYNRTDLPENADAALMILFYHDLRTQTGEQSVDTIAMNERIFAALRPGGTYFVVDHKARDLSGWNDTTLHRIDEATIIREVMAAGFELVATSNILANPDDDHTLSVRDASIRGSTDRALLVFRKPAE